ncbi:VWA domain-containing protein [Paenibacillus durus]|uniref:VWFA domain-containing protein n=1 Tax=Paenibacillus durus ATCC 35681 TaxID=1333534 RepID=A0A0F7F6A8_PAEDU|nr:VWA domain-containing protein [Paenibacillus durus]AKG33349.1 hypothetical protein VK70_00935 [Paenibacillus durus ATCC 35681]
MSIDLKKRAEENLINLSKKATISLAKKGLNGQKARVSLALDISGSMSGMYRGGIVQEVCERILSLAMNFDDNQAADVFLFGAKYHTVGEIQKDNFYQFVDREILSRFSLESSTNYAGVMNRIVDYYFPDALSVQKKGFLGLGKKEITVDENKYRNEEPVYVIFITDGNNFDQTETEGIIRQSSKLGIFWQFVGVGRQQFTFLKRLDDLKGRFIDNANFFQVNDLRKISDEELYDSLLNEFPSWLSEARSKSLIK